MDPSSFVTTSIGIPPPPRRGTHRLRLTDRLEKSLSHYKIALLSAPAAYGKTTFLAQWARSSQYPIGWLSLIEDVKDSLTFLRALLAAWEEIDPEVRDSRLGMLLGSMEPDLENVLAAFIQALDRLPEPLVFVVDDIQRLAQDPAQSVLAFLLDHLPPLAHFVLAGRGDPDLPLTRYRAKNEILEMREEDLRFTRDECQTFYSETMELELEPGDAARLHEQVEGWVGGLQLAGLSIQQGLTVQDEPVIGGDHRYIADYLSGEVLEGQPQDVQDFLLHTGLADRLCGPLCDALTGREDGQEMLETVESKGLFLQPLDDHREWYRYHSIFADYLHHELHRREPKKVPELHRKAAAWHLDQGLPEPAWHHALEGENLELAVRILERYMIAKILGGELVTVQRWLNEIPAGWRTKHPMIAMAQAAVLMATGQFEACANSLNEVEEIALQSQENVSRHQARATAMRCNIACFQNDLTRAEAFADQALQNLEEDDLEFRAGIYGALGDTYRRNGRWQEAEDAYKNLLDYTHTPTFRVQGAHVYGALADLALRQGKLQEAEVNWRQAMSSIQDRQGEPQPLPVVGWVYIRLGELQYEQNNLAEARKLIHRGLEYAELGGDVRSLIAGYLNRGRLKLTEGDSQGAREELENARTLVEDAKFPYWTGRYQRLLIEIWLAEDRLRTAVDWLDDRMESAVFQDGDVNIVLSLALARVLIIKGDRPSLDQALNLLQPLLERLEEEGRMGLAIETRALQALAHWKGGEPGQALIPLERALRLAEQEGYVRLFADLGLPMARLLQEAHGRDVLPNYVDILLSAYQAGVPDREDQPVSLPEPLTEREQEVLELMAAGLTNSEIGEELVIAPGTVKKHAGSIYGKLGVSNRTEAAAKARELNLLD